MSTPAATRRTARLRVEVVRNDPVGECEKCTAETAALRDGRPRNAIQRALLLNAKRLAESSATHRRRTLWGGHSAEAPALRGVASATPHYGELTINLLARGAEIIVYPLPA